MSLNRAQQISIMKIRMDSRTQARVQMDMEALTNYTEAFKRKERFPAVILFYDGKTYWIGDGWHRVQAAQQAGHKTISADVKKGTVEDAAWFSLSANQKNGVRFTNADKAKAVERALMLKPRLSNKAIAEHVGVSDTLVIRVRAEAERQNRIAPSAERVGSDGRTFTVSPSPSAIGLRKEVPPTLDPNACPTAHLDSVPPRVSDDSRPPETPTNGVVAEPLPAQYYMPPPSLDGPPPPPAQPPVEAPPAAAPEELLRDKAGNPIPEGRIAEAFRREPELIELRSTLLRVKKQVLDAIAACDPLYYDIAANPFGIAIDDVHRWIQHARPFAICPYCWGDNHDCMACKGRGWVNEVSHRQAPREMKVPRHNAVQP